MREARYETPGKRIPLLGGYRSADVRGEEDCVTSPKSVCVGGYVCPKALCPCTAKIDGLETIT